MRKPAPRRRRGPIENALRRARARVAAGWCQRAYARNASGRKCVMSSPAAARFCLVGAYLVRHGTRTENGKISRLLHRALPGSRPNHYKDPVVWNDTRGRRKAEVLRVYDRAIKLAAEARA